MNNRAIHEGFTVYYIRTSTLLEKIKLSRIDGTYTNLFEIIEIRSQLSSTIITLQLTVKDQYIYKIIQLQMQFLIEWYTLHIELK